MLAMTACVAGEGGGISPASRIITSGPAADYPVVLGDAYTIGGVEYEPVDHLNYDAVGYASVDKAGAAGITIAHKTLPLPSYVEVTSLETGRTILARVERRGPMVSDRLVELSTDAARQLGAGADSPVRIRRVLPPESQRSELRSDRAAPLRMYTPEGLLAVLRQQLSISESSKILDRRRIDVAGVDTEPHQLASIDPDGARATTEGSAEDPSQAEDGASILAAPVVEGSIPDEPARPAAAGGYFVQLGAFSEKSNAKNLAERVGGFLVQSGRFTLVRTGPYARRGQADAALAKLREQGYTDALIRNSD